MRNFKKIVSLVFIIFVFNFVNLFGDWTEQISGYSNRGQGIHTVNENVCWVCGVHGLLIRTTNSGINWLNVWHLPGRDTINFTSIFALSEDIALTSTFFYAPGLVTELYRTSNGGQTWNTILIQNSGFIDHVAFKDSLNGFLLADPVNGRWSLWKSSDAGLTWDSTGMYLPQAGNEASLPRDLEIQGNDIWFGTSNYRIYHSTDFGSTWSFAPVGMPLTLTIAMNNVTGFAAESYSYQTTDNGISWIQRILPGNTALAIFCFTHIENQFWYNRNGQIYHSSDNGSTFSLEYTAPNNIYWQLSMKKVNGHIVGWGIRDNGAISKYTEPIGIHSISSELPEKFNLYQNYPNPFNPITKFKFELTSKSNVNIAIYDAIGRQVEILVSEELTAGTYETEWNATNYPNGVYYYRLTAHQGGSSTGVYSETKKMVLVK